MNFLKAVKFTNSDYTNYMYREGQFENRLEFCNDILVYIEDKHNEHGEMVYYTPTQNDLLSNDWMIGSDQVIEEACITRLKGKPIEDITYIEDYEFVIMRIKMCRA